MPFKHKKSITIVSLLVIIILISGIFIKRYLQNKNFSRVHPRHGEITEAIYGLGKVKSNHRFEVKLGVLSTVKRLYVREGDTVKKNQPLIEFDSQVTITSPISGTVTLVSAYEGETALPQIPVVRVEDLHDRYIELSLEQEGLLRIQKGQKALVSFEALRGEVLTGSVIALFPKDDEFIAHVKIKNLKDNILPGMTADVSVEIGKINGLLIPIKAIRNGIVTRIRDNRTEKIKVDIGLSDNLSAEIKGDLIRPEDEILLPKEE